MIARKTYKPNRGASIDVLVAGAGLSGLLTAAAELKAGRKVHLTEKLPKPGGRFSPELRNGFQFGSGFSFGDAAAWKKISQYLSLNTSYLPVHNGNALVHGARGWVDMEEVPSWEAYWARPCTEFPMGGTSAFVESLLDYCASHDNFTYSLECPVTSLVVENGKIVKASLGSEIDVIPENVFWATDYKGIMEVLTGQVAEPGPERVSWLKRFVKSIPQPGVVLEFAHKNKMADFTETLLMPFTAGEKEERRYLVGSFASNRDQSLCPDGKSLSSWIMPLSELEWGDNHETMKKIRAGRRLLEKAFANFEQTIEFERVLVLDSTISPAAKKKGDWQLLLPNLGLVSDWAMPGGATFEEVVNTLIKE